MFYFLSRLAERYYRLGLRITGLAQSIRFPLIDFDKPWWSAMVKRWPLWIIIISGRIITTVFVTLIPLFIGMAFKAQGASYFVLLAVVWVIVEFWRFFTIYLFDVEQACITYGVRYGAYRFFLTVDPIYHAMRTSGRLFAKIHRGAHAYEDVANIFVYELLSIVGGVITVIISLFVLNRTVGFISFGFLFSLLLFNVGAILFNALAFERRLIHAEDDMKSVGMESLVQIELVRSSFAANEMDKAIRSKGTLTAATLATHWISFAIVMLITRLGYALSVCVIGLYVLSMIKQGMVSVVIGTSFLATYIHGSYRVMRVGEKSQKIVQCIIRVKDLFNFVRGFGLQTFPVLNDGVPERDLPIQDTISVHADDLEFAYTRQAQIFDKHNLDLVVPRTQKNKLYGIIGPSGIGKTTLISILGGQLRPTTGAVKVSDVPMYEVDDDTRRQLVAMQGQTASSLSGTVRDSLLLGLPKNKELFSDEELISVLQRVGLWKLFVEKEGLDSSVGEGGFNLSVGQRQRLNFAALYLRTNYFGPSLILIDEPTSSLDEISEQAITDMIDELARNAITFVIAHRLHTLERAVGILDVSLIEEEKNLIFYSRDKLMKKSPYYQKLIRGEVAIEE